MTTSSLEWYMRNEVCLKSVSKEEYSTLFLSPADLGLELNDSNLGHKTFFLFAVIIFKIKTYLFHIGTLLISIFLIINIIHFFNWWQKNKLGLYKRLVLFQISWQNRLLYNVIDFSYPDTLRLDINLPFYSHKGSLQEN